MSDLCNKKNHFKFILFYFQPIAPELYESFPSRVAYSWVTPLILRGHKRPLTEEDCWQLQIPERAVNIVHRVQACLDGLVFAYLLFYYHTFSRTINRAKSIAYKKSRPFNQYYISKDKQIEDENQDLVSFALFDLWNLIMSSCLFS